MTLPSEDRDDWVLRWRQGRIQFHSVKVNPILERYVNRLLPEGLGRVFVPLCGKSVDLSWLVAQGYEVVGIELVEEPVKSLFNENRQSPSISTYGGFQSWESGALTVLLGDLFELDAKVSGEFDAIWDRAALVALRPSVRARYTTHLEKFLRRDGRILLCTISYDESKMDGPPFSVSTSEVSRHFGGKFRVEKLEEFINNDPNLCFRENGIDRIVEEVWLIG
jgi:thiopurine S-methyltransferase